MDPSDQQALRQLLDDYLRAYAARDDRLTASFSEDFSGFTGGGEELVKDRQAWVAITRQDFAQVRDPLRLEVKDVSLQSLAETVAVATAFFSIHLPIQDHVLSRETARLVLVFRREAAGWKISHSSISIPYHLVREGEVYPLQELTTRTQVLEQLVAERTQQLSEANAVLAREIAGHQQTEAKLRESEALYRSILDASPDDITIADLEGRVLLVSSGAVPMFGGESAAQGTGRRVTDFLVPEDRARAMSRVALLLQGVAPGPSEYRGLRLDGTTFDLEVNSALLRDAEGRPSKLVVVARDVTARKQTEAALQQAVAQIKTLHGLLPICMHCKKIRDDQGQWSPVEVFVRERTDAEFSHGLCPQCLAAKYPDLTPGEGEP
ncbi:MAG: nuclear transport factor 2 family protein [Anaeromyxobacter sp.]|nr:nuclear transport factor 2 family protein [Anaeromyxobacter sp.]MBL0276888.1 nuclear transport factor 2 family protein [Anaeromyxobacter sp.]